MNQFFKTVVERKKLQLEKLESKTLEEITPKETITAIMLAEGYVTYLPKDFDLQVFIQVLKEFLQKEFKFDTQTVKHDENLFQISYVKHSVLKNKLGLSETYSLFLLQNENELIMHIRTGNDRESTWASSIKSIFSSSEEDKLIDFAEDYIYNLVTKNQTPPTFFKENHLIDELPKNFKIWYLTSTDSDELLLAKLRISEIKTLPMLLPQDALVSSYFLLTTKNYYMVGFDKQNEIVFFEAPSSEIKRSRGILRDTLEAGDHKWTTRRTNARLFAEALEIMKLTGFERLPETAKFNFLGEHEDIAAEQLQFYVSMTGNLSAQFFYTYILYTQQKSDFRPAEFALREIAKQPQSVEALFSTAEAWKMTAADKGIVTELLVKLSENQQIKESLAPIYKKVRDEFYDKVDDAFATMLFDVRYCNYLIEIGKQNDAIKILTDNLAKCPDESISDMLSSPETAPSGTQMGQLLHVRMHETLAKAGHKSQEQLLKLAKLQAVNLQRLEELAKCADCPKHQSANDLHVLFSNPLLQTEPTIGELKRSFTEKSLKEKLNHQFLRKNGSFDSVQKWLEKQKINDSSTIKTFGELIGTQNFDSVFKIINELKKAFVLPDVELYVARGDKSRYIIGYEGNPAFIMLGEAFLRADSPLLLNSAELRFALASELCHIKLNHTRLTASDTWRNAADRGKMFADTILNEFPISGIDNDGAENMSSLSALETAVHAACRANQAGDVFGCVAAVGAFYKSENHASKKELSEYKLLGASRLLQYTADRSGLIFAGNMAASLSAILKTSEAYHQAFLEMSQYPISAVLDKTDNEQKFKYQQLAQRLAALASYYLSDDYTELLTELFHQ